MYLWRRSHKEDGGEIDDFNARAFKAQSVILPDEGMPSRSASTYRGGHGGYRSPSPPMMEQNMANVPPSFVGAPHMHQDYDPQAAYYNNGYNNGYDSGYNTSYNNGYPAPPSFAPGQYIATNQGQVAPPSPVNPFVAPFGQVPVNVPMDGSPYDYAHRAQSPPRTPPAALIPGSPHVTRQPSMGAAQSLARQPSAAGALGQSGLYNQPSDIAAQLLSRRPSAGVAQYPGQQSPRTPAPEAAVGPDPHYVDLNRSSVTPFQAAQYTEISRRLNIAPPSPMSSPHEMNYPATSPGLGPVMEDSDSGSLSRQASLRDKDLPSEPPAYYDQEDGSPFSDSEEVQEVTLHSHSAMYDAASKHDSFGPLPLPRFEQHARVPSTPPILPEIHIQQRAFSPVSADYPIAPSSARPSPLSSSFGLPSPPPQAHVASTPTSAYPLSISAVANKATHAPAGLYAESAVRRPDTVYTLYDDDDAYGGI
ncbi:hypothetical protein IEO21_02916 [Rhodonia placenta]|uniref:Uncharacterized protein n=1 Tax=Rhodonia placenta TaxID=104341 RepID=A0A8H7P6Y2_9APHY|nr:hypothetical protein IEO21_02916 [Postia placenta]